MKTRIVYTKLWEDDFVSSLTIVQKALFLYFLTNQRIGQTGMYEVPDRIIMFETGATKDQLEVAKEVFMKAGKILFTNGWVKVVNSNEYNAYTGDNNEKARLKELEGIPQEIINTFNTLLEGVKAPSIPVEGLTNHNNKSEITNKEGVVKGEKTIAYLDNIPDDDLKEFTSKYNCSEFNIRSKADDLRNYCRSHGKRYKNYKAFLSNALKKDFGVRKKVIQGAQSGYEVISPEKLEKIREGRKKLLGGFT